VKAISAPAAIPNMMEIYLSVSGWNSNILTVPLQLLLRKHKAICILFWNVVHLSHAFFLHLPRLLPRFYKNKAITAEVRPCTCVPIMTPIKGFPGIMKQ
jgi:hypothetical protein